MYQTSETRLRRPGPLALFGPRSASDQCCAALRPVPNCLNQNLNERFHGSGCGCTAVGIGKGSGEGKSATTTICSSGLKMQGRELEGLELFQDHYYRYRMLMVWG